MVIYTNYSGKTGSYEDFLKNTLRQQDEWNYETYISAWGNDQSTRPTIRQLAKLVAREMVDISCKTHMFRQYWMDYTKLIFTSNSYEYEEFFGVGLYDRHPSLYVMFLRFACKLIKKEFDKNNYYKIYDKLKSFLYDLYFSDEMDFCTSVNNSLIKNDITSVKFSYTYDTIEAEFNKNIKNIQKDMGAFADYKYENNREISYIGKAFNNMRTNIPPRTYGVYFLFEQNLSLAYVGYSNNLQMRILQSMKDKKLRNFAYLVCDNKDMATSLERYFITKLRPKLNSSQMQFKHKDVDFEIPEITNIYCLKIDELMASNKIPKDFDVFTIEEINIPK